MSDLGRSQISAENAPMFVDEAGEHMIVPGSPMRIKVGQKCMTDMDTPSPAIKITGSKFDAIPEGAVTLIRESFSKMEANRGSK